jgi:hypothetical protein
LEEERESTKIEIRSQFLDSALPEYRGPALMSVCPQNRLYRGRTLRLRTQMRFLYPCFFQYHQLVILQFGQGKAVNAAFPAQGQFPEGGFKVAGEAAVLMP